MKSNKSSFRWLRLRFRRSLAVSLVAFMVWPMLLPAMALANDCPPEATAKYEPVPDPGPNSWNAPAGQVYTKVWIKAGSDNQEGYGHILYTQDTNDGHYSVSGIGTGTLTVSRVGEGPGTKEISHIDVFWSTAPPETHPGISIDKSNAPTVTAGDDSTFTITVTNTGDTTLTNVVVTDELEAGLTLDADKTSPSPAVSGSTLTWTIASLAPGAHEDIILVVNTSSANVYHLYHNTAVVNVSSEKLTDSDEGVLVVDPRQTTIDEAKPTTPSVTPPLLPPVVASATYDLSIKKVDDVDPAYVGDTVTYTMTVRNTGNQPLTGLAFKDSLPTGMLYKSSTSGISKQSSSGVYAWSLTKLDSGASRTFKISTTAGKVGVWVNTVSVTANEIPTPKEADEQTRVFARLAVAPETVEANVSAGTSGSSLPFTGFPLTIWWLTTAGVLAAGLWLEITTRRKARHN